MFRRVIVTTCQYGVVTSLLLVVLFASACEAFPSPFGQVLTLGVTLCEDKDAQWIIFLALLVYFLFFLFLHLRRPTIVSPDCAEWQSSLLRYLLDPTIWLACALLISGVVYLFRNSCSINALMLLAAAVIGQGVAALTRLGKITNKGGENLFFAPILTLLLTIASIWNLNVGRAYEYHGQARWSGPWGNPNICGLLMGTGIALAFGTAVRAWMMRSQERQNPDVSWKVRLKSHGVAALCLGMAGFMGWGLVRSYSRGALVGTFCGLLYFVFQMVKDPCFRQMRVVRWIMAHRISLVVSICAIAVLAFWQFQKTEHPLLRRAFSFADLNDFSWRNRIAAWKGALQITAEYPALGAGWDQPELLYENYYLGPKSTESAAIRTNDYLMFGATLGLPALICFGGFLWGSLTRTVQRRMPAMGLDHELSPDPAMIYRAGAIVLLIGFCFDEGLFKIPTTIICFILLELGREEKV